MVTVTKLTFMLAAPRLDAALLFVSNGTEACLLVSCTYYVSYVFFSNLLSTAGV